MSHDEIQDLLGAFALDAVDADEARAVEDHLRECARCRAEVAEHREAAAFLAHAGEDAPPALWDRIASTIDDDAPAGVVPLAPKLGSRGGSWTRRRSLPAAVVGIAAAAVIAVLGFQLREQDQRMDEMEAALRVPEGEVVELTGDAGTVPVVMNGDRAWLLAGALDELPDGRTYQLWGLAGDELVSVAVLGRDPGTMAFDADGYALLAITEEDAPGVVQSANDPVAAGELG
jgi:anti-sigma-K factor RskA